MLYFREGSRRPSLVEHDRTDHFNDQTKIFILKNSYFLLQIGATQLLQIGASVIKKLGHNNRYPTNFSNLNFSLKSYALNNTKFSISFRGPKLWNDILNKQEKEIQPYKLFQKKMKTKLLDLENEISFF